MGGLESENPLADKRIRSGIGLLSASILVVVGILFFDPPTTYLFLGIAAIDAVLTPYMLGLGLEAEQ